MEAKKKIITVKKEVWPESDSDGYPTEETLKYIREWPVSPVAPKANFEELLEFCMEAWKYEEYTFKKNGQYIFQTGGWSGNEDIISSMRKNRIFWMFTWYSSRRGGHYKFDILGSI